jgi:hypothetical protein
VSSATGNGGTVDPPAAEHGTGGNAEAGPGENNDDGSTFGSNQDHGTTVDNA